MDTENKKKDHSGWIYHSFSLIENVDFFSAKEWQKMIGDGAFTPPEAPPARETLGAYVEWLAAGAISANPSTELIAQNIQFFEGKRTIGEMDFLLRHGAEVLHLELAVKFYLCVGDLENMAHWVGPNVHDSMAKKHQKLTQKQLLLAKNPEIQAQLRALGLPVPQKARALIKGRIFYPHSQWQQGKRAPWAASGHPAGWWIVADDMEVLNVMSSKWYICASKRDWLLEGAPCAGVGAVSFSEMKEAHSATPKPVMVYDISGESFANSGFVVPKTWQNEAQKTL